MSNSSSLGFRDWLKTPTGMAVGVFWVLLLVAALMVVRLRIPLIGLEAAAAWFGLYGSSVAFRKDRQAGVVILIALAFSFMLLNTGLYMTLIWSNPMSR